MMKGWQVILAGTPLLAVGAYIYYCCSTADTELDRVEKALGGGRLVSTKLVATNSDKKTAFPLPEIQRIYVVHKPYEKVLTEVSNSLNGKYWHVVHFRECYLIESNGYSYMNSGPSLYYSKRGDSAVGDLTIESGKYTSSTPFGAGPRIMDPEYTTIYVSWIKNDPISKALSKF